MKAELTQERLKELLYYNKQFGIFVRRIRRGPAKIGDIAGTPDKDGYILIGVDGIQYKAHRMALLYVNGSFPPHDVDHENGHPEDNSFKNLREATRAENCRNQKKRIDNTSGIIGVYWNKQLNKWESRIHIDEKSIYLGVYGDFFEACCIRKSAELKYKFHHNHGRSSVAV